MGPFELAVVLIAVMGLLTMRRSGGFLAGLRRGIKEFRKASGQTGSELWNSVDQSGFDAGRYLGGALGRPAGEALTLDNQTAEICDPPELRGHLAGADSGAPWKWSRPVRLAAICVLIVAAIAIIVAAVAR